MVLRLMFGLVLCGAVGCGDAFLDGTDSPGGGNGGSGAGSGSGGSAGSAGNAGAGGSAGGGGIIVPPGPNDPNVSVDWAPATGQPLDQIGPMFDILWDLPAAITHANYTAGSADERSQQETLNLECEVDFDNGLSGTWPHSPNSASRKDRYRGPCTSVVGRYECPSDGGDVAATGTLIIRSATGTWSGPMPTVHCRDNHGPNGYTVAETVCMRASAGDSTANCRPGATQVVSPDLDAWSQLDPFGGGKKYVQVVAGNYATPGTFFDSQDTGIQSIVCVGSDWDYTNANKRINAAPANAGAAFSGLNNDRVHGCHTHSTNGGSFMWSHLGSGGTSGFDGTSGSVVSGVRVTGFANLAVIQHANTQTPPPGFGAAGYNQLLDTTFDAPPNANRDNIIYLGNAYRSILDGVSILQDPTGGSHAVRNQGGSRSVIAHSFFGGAGFESSTVANRGNQLPTHDMKRVSFYENTLQDSTAGVPDFHGFLQNGPQNEFPGLGNGDMEVVEYCYFGRNLFHIRASDVHAGPIFANQGPENMYIENVAVVENSTWDNEFVRSRKRGPAPVNADLGGVEVHGNVLYHVRTGGSVQFATFADCGSSNCGRSFNNLAVVSSGVTLASDSVGSGSTGGNGAFAPGSFSNVGGLTLQDYFPVSDLAGRSRVLDYDFGITGALMGDDPGMEPF